MIWADRAGLAWGIFISLALTIAGTQDATLETKVLGCLEATAPIWIILRLIDFVFGGYWYRRKYYGSR